MLGSPQPCLLAWRVTRIENFSAAIFCAQCRHALMRMSISTWKPLKCGTGRSLVWTPGDARESRRVEFGATGGCEESFEKVCAGDERRLRHATLLSDVG